MRNLKDRTGTLADPWLLGLMAAGLVLRVALAILVDAEMVPRGDEGNYLRQATALRNTGELETGVFVRPPLYFLMLAGTQILSELCGLTWSLTTRLLQCVLAVATAIPVYRCADRVSGRRAGRLASAFLLLDPTLIAYSHLLWPETLFLLFVAIVFHGIAELERRPLWQIASLGLVTGLALLLKPVFGVFTVILAISWLLRLGPARALRLALVFGGTAALVISPWLIRNQLRYGPAILIENQGPYNLWVGNDPRAARDVLDEWRSLPDPVTRSRVGTERGLEAMGADPGRFFRHGAVRALNLWGLEFFVVRHIIIGGYGEVARGRFLLAFWVIQVAYALVLFSAAAGLGPASRDRTLRLLLLYAAAFTVLVALMVTTTRFRVPFGFLISVSAGIGLDRVMAGRLTRRSLVALALGLVVLGLSASRPVFRRIISANFETLEELDHFEWRFFRY